MLVDTPQFLLTVGVLTLIPGAGQAVVLRQTLEHGARSALLTVLGTATALMLWTTAAAAGLSALLLASDTAYLVLRLLGALVLAWLGVTTLSSLRRAALHADTHTQSTVGLSRRSAYATGLLMNLWNPKAGVFAVSVIPQFVAPAGPTFPASLLLGALWAAVTLAWYAVVFIPSVNRGRQLMSRPVVQQRMRLASGIALVGLAGSVAAGI